jgi:peptidoglycan/LPS O-acetylase OafA/YrhL
MHGTIKNIGVGAGLGQRFLVLDTWRGIAALTVAFGHLKTNGLLSSLPLSSLSYRLVDFFFVLSGFVIAHSSWRNVSGERREAARFLVRRFFRLWPLHVFILALFFGHQCALAIANFLGIVKSPLAFDSSFSSSWLPHNLALVQAWELTPYNTWNEPAWSISTEMFAYLTFVVAFLFLGRIAFAALAAVFAVAFYFAWTNSEIMTATYSWAIVRCLFGFCAGVTVYWIWTKVKGFELPRASAVELASVAAVVCAVLYIPSGYGALVVPVFCVCVLVFSLEAGRLSGYLKQGHFVWLGDRSYSIYLGHAFLVTAIYSLAAVTGSMGKLETGQVGILAPVVISDLLVVAFLVLTVVFSAYTYKYIEEPGRRAGRLIRL